MTGLDSHNVLVMPVFGDNLCLGSFLGTRIARSYPVRGLLGCFDPKAGLRLPNLLSATTETKNLETRGREKSRILAFQADLEQTKRSKSGDLSLRRTYTCPGLQG